MSQVPVNVQLTAVLKDNTNNPLQGATVQFSYKLSSASSFTSGGSATTDSTGTATVTLSLMAPDVYDFVATFNGTTSFGASNVQIMFDTTSTGPAQTQLTVQVTVSGAAVSVAGNLSSSGVPVAGAQVGISVDGTAVGSATTDSSGNYSAQLTNAPGAHTVMVNYAGSAAYAPSQASSTFGGAPGGGVKNALVAGAVVVAAAAAAAVAFVTMRKR